MSSVSVKRHAAADMPDDVAMLDLVWDGVAADVGDEFIDAMGIGTNEYLAIMAKNTANDKVLLRCFPVISLWLFPWQRNR